MVLFTTVRATGSTAAVAILPWPAGFVRNAPGATRIGMIYVAVSNPGLSVYIYGKTK